MWLHSLVLLRKWMQSSILMHFVSNIQSAWFHIFAEYININFFKYLAYLNLNILLLSFNRKCLWASLFFFFLSHLDEEIIIKEMHILYFRSLNYLFNSLRFQTACLQITHGLFGATFHTNMSQNGNLFAWLCSTFGSRRKTIISSLLRSKLYWI